MNRRTLTMTNLLNLTHTTFVQRLRDPRSASDALSPDSVNQREQVGGSRCGPRPPRSSSPLAPEFGILEVLGGGPAGLVAAMTAAAGGHRVAMTEQRLTGGTCVNFGCTPSKALIRCARAIHDAGRGAEFGFRLDGPPRAEFGAVMERVRRIRARSSEGDAVQAVEKGGLEGDPGQ